MFSSLTRHILEAKCYIHTSHDVLYRLNSAVVQDLTCMAESDCSSCRAELKIRAVSLEDDSSRSIPQHPITFLLDSVRERAIVFHRGHPATYARAKCRDTTPMSDLSATPNTPAHLVPPHPLNLGTC